MLYTGTGSGYIDVTGVGFNPDFVWAKNRQDSHPHAVWDKVRGENKQLNTNETSSEISRADNSYEFITDGFRVGTGGNSNNANTYVAWNWKANGSGVSNTSGSITSTVSANVDAGFSIVSYTGNTTAGATFGHGLSSAPEMVICKSRGGTGGWAVGHLSIGFTTKLALNTTQAESAETSIWNDTAPSNTLVTLGSDTFANANTTMISYCFHSVDGYSKVGSYTGNGSTDGTFVYTGFRPAYVMIKRTDSAYNWAMYDNQRDSMNPNSKQLYANRSNAEYDDAQYTAMDFVSNGFKWRTNNTGENVGAFIFIAFAETPFKYSTAK